MKFKQWQVAPPCPDGRRALEESGLSPLLAAVLSARGVTDPEEARRLLSPQAEPLLDPMLMRDMDRAVARVRRAVENGETITVYGDYDVDGITSTCLLTQFLQSLGADVRPYIPGRLEEGYGLNHEAVAAQARQGVGLIITVDCGITALDEADYARELGVDLVITDHHACKDRLPQAAAVVDPHRPDCPYPFKGLAGVGVALKLAMAVAGPEKAGAVFRQYRDLAAVGTVADVMPMTGENRTIVRQGLDDLHPPRRLGFAKLIECAGLSERPMTSVTVGYALAPRINASGRLGRAEVALELLLTQDPDRAEALAQTLCDLNRERQTIEGDIFQQCVQRLTEQPQSGAIVLADQQWHQGVVGIVASRLAEKYSCPAFMICLQDGKGKGSCRSFAGFNLFAALERCAPLLEGFGGHALAAGFTIREENIPAFAAAMNDYVCACTGGEEMVSALDIDGELDDVGLLTLEGVEGLELLEPYGAGNPKPVFSLSGCLVSAVNEVGGGRHLKLKLTASGRSFDAIFFSATAEEAGVGPGDRVDVAFTPQINEYRGWRSVQLQLCDLRPALTRAQAERALYEKFRRGEPLTRQEAEALLPSREEFVTLWRYLKGHAGQAPLEATAHRLARSIARSAGRRETVMRTLVCLEVFDERGLIRLEHTTDHLHIALRSVDGKVNLDDSCIMRKLRHILSNG